MYAIGPEIKHNIFISVLESSTILFDHDCIYENSSVVVVFSEPQSTVCHIKSIMTSGYNYNHVTCYKAPWLLEHDCHVQL